jgi:hypothetical protein
MAETRRGGRSMRARTVFAANLPIERVTGVSTLVRDGNLALSMSVRASVRGMSILDAFLMWIRKGCRLLR